MCDILTIMLEKHDNGLKAYLPEKNIPSTHVKATSLSANDVELQMEISTIIFDL